MDRKSKPKKIYVWGTGRALGALLDFVLPLEFVTAFVVSEPHCKEHLGKPVLCPEELKNCNYDAVVVSCDASQAVRQRSLEAGLDISKFIFTYNNAEISDLNQDTGLIREILGNDFSDVLANRYHLIRSVESDDLLPERRRHYGIPLFQNDYVRCKTLELVADEIKAACIQGAIAEFGVFRGEFAALLNDCFPERKLYLFDTFSGFDPEEAQQELDRKNCNTAFINAFSNTSIETVLAAMPARKNVIIKAGYFPESAIGMEKECFALVSLDVDFEKSTRAGLEFFYPRLNPGGYLFIHDYNSRLSGIRHAVAEFEKNLGQSLKRVPICDANGTLILIK